MAFSEYYQSGESFQTGVSPLATMRLSNPLDHLLPAELLEIVSGMSRAVALIGRPLHFQPPDPPLPNT